MILQTESQPIPGHVYAYVRHNGTPGDNLKSIGMIEPANALRWHLLLSGRLPDEFTPRPEQWSDVLVLIPGGYVERAFPAAEALRLPGVSLFMEGRQIDVEEELAITPDWSALSDGALLWQLECFEKHEDYPLPAALVAEMNRRDIFPADSADALELRGEA